MEVLELPTGKDGPWLGGQDFGGLMAAELAARHGAPGLVLSSCPLSRLWTVHRLTALPPLHIFFYELAGGRVFLSEGVRPTRKAEFLRQQLPRLQADPYMTRRMRRIAQALRSGVLGSLRPRLKRIGLPVLFLWGREDRFAPLWTAQRSARSWKQAKVVALDGGRHYAPFGVSEAYGDALVAFLDGQQTLNG